MDQWVLFYMQNDKCSKDCTDRSLLSALGGSRQILPTAVVNNQTLKTVAGCKQIRGNV